MNIAAALPPLSILNAWARGTHEQHLSFSCTNAVYDMKRRVIMAAIEAGICEIKLVQCVRPCLACKGTGTYVWINWNDEDDQRYEDCRRCAATPGSVTLRFIETNILGTKFHTPSNRADFLKHLSFDWKKCEETDWTPQQPGRSLERFEIITLLNEAERYVFGEKMLRWHNGWKGSIYDYSLNFGDITECFVCGHEARGIDGTRPYLADVHRPGMKWNQGVCADCRLKADRWPRQWPASLFPARWNRGQWITEWPNWGMNAPLPPMADTDVVREWLRRRGIQIGAPVPTEYSYWNGVFCQVAAVRDDKIYFTIADSQDWRYAGFSQTPIISAPVNEFSALPIKLLGAAA